jgi:succinylarginine dihydrolase
MFVEQSEEAIAAGAFHNDVVAVANEHVLFAHEKAFADRSALVVNCERLVPGFELVEVPDAEVPLADAISSYLFNAQLVTPPDSEMTLVVPEEARETPSVWTWLQRHLVGNGPIRRVQVVDVRQSMANGGGPACLRLRVAADADRVDPRFLVDEAKLDRLSAVIAQHWPEEIANADLTSESLIGTVERARAALLDALELGELV